MSLDDWVAEWGWEGVQKLARLLGGRRMYVPLHCEHPAIREALGARAPAFHRRFGGDTVEVPTLEAVSRAGWLREACGHALALLEEGRSVRSVAAATGLHRRTVGRLQRRLGQ